MLQEFGVPLSILGPVAGGALADWQGNYVMAFLILPGLSALAATVYFLVGQPKPAAPTVTRSAAR